MIPLQTDCPTLRFPSALQSCSVKTQFKYKSAALRKLFKKKKKILFPQEMLNPHSSGDQKHDSK